MGYDDTTSTSPRAIALSGVPEEQEHKGDGTSAAGSPRKRSRNHSSARAAETPEKRQRRLAQNRESAKIRRHSERSKLEQLQTRKIVLAYDNDCLKREREALRKYHSKLSLILNKKPATTNQPKSSSSQKQQLPCPPLHGHQVVGYQRGPLGISQSLQPQQQLLLLMNHPSLLTTVSVHSLPLQQYEGLPQEQLQVAESSSSNKRHEDAINDE